MNNRIISLMLAGLALAGCSRTLSTENAKGEGELSFASCNISCNDELDVLLTKAAFPATGNYTIEVFNAEGFSVLSTTYAAVKTNSNKISLPAGNYRMEICSSDEEIPAAVFEGPVYGATQTFAITAGQTTEIGSITCHLLQCKVTVSYDDAFLADVTGPGCASVEVTTGYPLDFNLGYIDNSAIFDQSAGYFAVNNGDNTTMTVTFKGKVGGKDQKMISKPITGIKPAQWRQVKFIKKIDQEGNASFGIEINGFIEDEDLDAGINVPLETVIAEDPNAPIGDGGIEVFIIPECTMFTDLSNIVVPKRPTEMDLRLKAIVPAGVLNFTVEVESTSPGFCAALEAAGGGLIDLVHPSTESEVIFQVVPFPHGEELIGMTEVDFNLSAAQDPILAFPGTHSFKMNITDSNHCKKTIPVVMIVEE